jgi:hypothetical protein
VQIIHTLSIYNVPNSLFPTIDLDNNGTVDFLEFCTFMGQCSDNYRLISGGILIADQLLIVRLAVLLWTIRLIPTAACPRSTLAPGTDDTAKLVSFEDATKAAALEARKDEQEKEETA